MHTHTQASNSTLSFVVIDKYVYNHPAVPQGSMLGQRTFKLKRTKNTLVSIVSLLDFMISSCMSYYQATGNMFQGHHHRGSLFSS